MLRTAIRMLAWLLVVILSQNPAVHAQTPDEGALVASTGMFEFYSRFRLNLHDRLYMRSRRDEPPSDSSACYAGLSEADRIGWTRADNYYRQNMARRHHRTDSLMLALRYELGHVEGAKVDFDVDGSGVESILDGAAPAYRQCWWPDDDARNRRWVSELIPLLQAHEDTIRTLLEGYFRERWPEHRLHVDIVTYASWAGANTVVHPIHLMMSSADPDYRGDYALEMIFHESSHAIMHNGKLREVDPDPPRNLWHAILFYTVGETTRRVLNASGNPGYTPYMFKNGVFDSYHKSLVTAWTPYLNGEINWVDAVGAVIAESD